jgi:PAS domain S-box-containing protein
MFNISDTSELALLAKAVDSASHSLIITDERLPDRPIIFCNAAFEQLTGYTRQEVLGRNCRFLQGDDRRQPAIEELRQTMIAGRGCTVRIRNYRKNGTLFWNELVLSPVLGEDAKPIHYIGIQQDVTATLPVGAQKDFRELFNHELKTPLTTIKGNLQILQQKGMSIEPDFLEKSLSSALRAVARLEKLSRELFKA